MLPVDYHKASPNDISKRFKHSLIDYAGYPFWVTRTIGHDLNYEWARLDGYVIDGKSCDAASVHRKVFANDPKLSIKSFGKQFGYMNMEDFHHVMFADRVPRRGMVQGFSSSTGLFGRYGNDETRYFVDLTQYPLNAKMYKCENLETTYRPSATTRKRRTYWGDKLGMSYEWAGLLFSEGLVNMWKNIYPHAPEVLDTINDERAVAVSRRHVIELDKFGDRFMACNGNRVAKFIGSRLRYAPGKDYLSGDVERSLGFQPV